MNLRIYLFVSGLKEVKISRNVLYYPRGLGAFPQSFHDRDGVI